MAGKIGSVGLRKVETLDGFVVNWLLCGPFNEDRKLTSCEALEKDYVGETTVMPHAGEKAGANGPAWVAIAVRHGAIVDIRKVFYADAIAGYACAYIDSAKAQRAKFLLGSDDGAKVWLNGRMAWKNHAHRGLGFDNDSFEAELKKGVNVLLFKVEQNFGAYEFCLRLTNPQGRAVKGVKVLLDHPDVKNPVNPAKERSILTTDYLTHKIAKARTELSFKAGSAAEYKRWQLKFIKKFKSLLGSFPAKCPLKPEITEEVEVENFVRRRVLIDFEPGFSIPCYVTAPKAMRKGAKRPAVLCLHGHGSGKRDMLGMDLGKPDEPAYLEPYAMALHSARRGYITISPDFMAFGERFPSRPFGAHQDPCPALFAWSQFTGLVPTTLNIWAVMRCIDYLETLPQVDSTRIAAMGHSFGGYMTTMATAVEKRIKVAVISGAMSTKAASEGTALSCGSQVVPGIMNLGDAADIVCTYVPRPVLMITGLYDSCAPAPYAFAACKKIKKAYKLMGLLERAEQFIFSGDHIFQPEAAMKWLEKWL